MQEAKTNSMPPAVSKLLKWMKRYVLVLILVVVCIGISFFSPKFLTMGNMMNILRQMSFTGIAALGMTFVIISGCIDLSAGGIAACVGVVTSGLMMNSHLPIPLAVFLGLCLGAFFGLLNGIGIAKLRIPPFIMTLCMMNFAQGIAYVYCKAQSIYNLPREFTKIATSYVGPIPMLVIVVVVLAIIMWLILTKTTFGRHVFAIGGNRSAAEFSGIPVVRTQAMVYVIMGFLAGLAGILLAARVTAGDPASGSTLHLDAIAATVMGGTSIGGGVGGVVGSLIGAIMISVIDNALVILNFSTWWQPVVKALVIFAAVLTDVMNKARKH